MLGTLDITGFGESGGLEKRIILYFSATWCAPCKKLGPLIKKVSEYYAKDVLVVKVDADLEKPLVNFYEIQSVPTLVLLKDDVRWEKTQPVLSEKWLDNYFLTALIKK